jgi:IS5 family transposase
MPNKHNDARRHHIPKMKFWVTNWSTYEAGLRRRGSLMLWVSDEAIAAWKAAPRKTPGGQARYSETAIETALMVRLVFHQPLRQTEGLLGSLLDLMGVDLPVPDHTTISRRAARLTPVLRTALPDGPVTLVIDSTGLKVDGAGEWHHDKHGVRGRRTWRKLHLAVDAATNIIVAATLTTSGEGDAGQVDPLLDQTAGPIDTVMADGAYDGEPTYQTVAERDPATTMVIPPRSTAVPGPGANPTQRDRHIQSLADKGRLGWQREIDYGRRSMAETAMSRYKRILGDHLHARKLSNQQAEAAIGVAVLDRMIDARCPDSVPIA